MKKTGRIIPVILFVLAGIAALAGAGYIAWEKTGHFKEIGKKNTETVSAEIIEPLPVNENGTDADKDSTEISEDKTDVSENAADVSENGEEITEPEPEPVTLIENPYKDWFLKNSDMAAWLVIPDTIVDYPVMWTPGDEEHYLHLNFEGVKQRGGCLILDTDTCLDPLTTNLIIHGHNNKNQMFGDLSKYEDKDYRDEHPYIYLYDKNYQHIYEVMCVFRSQVFKKSDTCFKYYNFFNAETEEEFDYFYRNIKALEYYDTGVTAEFGDHFLTLSTCSYHVTNGRFVVVAKEIEPGDHYEPFEDTEGEE